MVVGLGTGATLMVLFGEHPTWLGGAEYDLRIRMQQLGPITEGTVVNMNGVEVGRVAGLEFTNAERPNEGVFIVARIKNKFAVPLGTLARVYVSPIGLGRGRIDLMPPDLPPDSDVQLLPLEGAIIMGEMGNMLGEILPPTFMGTLERSARQIGDFSAALTPVAQDVHELLVKRPVAEVDDPVALARQVTGNLYTLIERLDGTLRHFNEVLGDPEVQSGLRDAVANIRLMTEDGRATFANLRDTSASLRTDVKRVTDKLEGAVDNASGRIDRMGEAVIPLLDNSADLARNLKEATRQLAEGNGTIGRLLRDARLYETLLISVERLTDLLDTLRRLAAKFERQGYVEFKYQSVVGPVKGKRDIPEP
jgi:ABC-type transporter Mla subunit MlaD